MGRHAEGLRCKEVKLEATSVVLERGGERRAGKTSSDERR